MTITPADIIESWSFEEIAGLGRGNFGKHHLSQVNTPVGIKDGIVRGAVYLDQSTVQTYLFKNATGDLDVGGTDPWSCSIFWRGTTPTENLQVWSMWGATVLRKARIYSNATNTMRFEVRDEPDVTLSGGFIYPDNTWLHLVGVFDGSDGRFYGTPVTESQPRAAINMARGKGINNGSGSIWGVGTRGGSLGLSGDFDCCHFINRAITDDEVAQLFNEGKARQIPELSGRTRARDRSAEPVLD